MNKSLLVVSLVVTITNIFGMPPDGNSRKRSLCLSETIDRGKCSNKKAKINKNIIEVNANNKAQLINIFEKERYNAEQKKERSKIIYQKTMDLYLKEKNDRTRFCYWTPKLEEISNVTSSCSNEISELNQIIQFIKDNPLSNLEIPLTFGKAQKRINNDSKFIEIVNKIFGISIHSREEAESLIWEAFNAFEPYKKGKNILFWNGKAYVNGALSIFPVSDLRIKGRNYHLTQLYEILGYKREDIEAVAIISNGFPLLNKAITWFSIKNFWKEAKVQKDSQIDKTLQKHKRSCRRFFHEHIECAANYIKAAKTLGIRTKDLDFSQKELSEPHNKAEGIVREFLDKFGDYIGEFNKKDQKQFIENMNHIKNLLYAPSLLEDYSIYAHTEYIVRYLQKRNREKTEPTYMASYYDMCRDCEILFAESTQQEVGKDNTIIISGYDYKLSRGRGHPQILSNKSFLQIQL
ncbi:MAG: hypothetical protein J6P84_05770 [Alphaproteobacteria bacterium]|nr:hypothetical protein [Alphaproteobacteria bacterium]